MLVYISWACPFTVAVFDSKQVHPVGSCAKTEGGLLEEKQVGEKVVDAIAVLKVHPGIVADT